MSFLFKSHLFACEAFEVKISLLSLIHRDKVSFSVSLVILERTGDVVFLIAQELVPVRDPSSHTRNGEQ